MAAGHAFLQSGHGAEARPRQRGRPAGSLERTHPAGIRDLPSACRGAERRADRLGALRERQDGRQPHHPDQAEARHLDCSRSASRRAPLRPRQRIAHSPGREAFPARAAIFSREGAIAGAQITRVAAGTVEPIPSPFLRHALRRTERPVDSRLALLLRNADWPRSASPSFSCSWSALILHVAARRATRDR